MMEFLQNIMESQYFTIGIFAVVAVLAIIFLILLLGGKKKEQVIPKDELDTSNDVLNEQPIVTTSAELDPITKANQEAIIEPVTDFKPAEFHPEEVSKVGEQTITNINLFDAPAPIDIAPVEEPISEPEAVIEQPVPSVEEPISQFAPQEPVAPDLNESPISNPAFDNTVSLNPQQFSSVFVSKQDESAPSEIVSPAMDLPKLNPEVEVKQEEVKNDIEMPQAQAPRPFDIEDRDL